MNPECILTIINFIYIKKVSPNLYYLSPGPPTKSQEVSGKPVLNIEYVCFIELK